MSCHTLLQLQVICWNGAFHRILTLMELSSSPWRVVPTELPVTLCEWKCFFATHTMIREGAQLWLFCVFFPPPFCLFPFSDISGRTLTLAWHVLPICLWRVNWKEGHGWSLWASLPPPILLSTITWHSWSTRSGEQAVPCVSAALLP